MGDRRLLKWQIITVATLCVGYAGFYFCRVNLWAVGPVLVEHADQTGVTKTGLGLIFSVGTLCYALGKLLNGVVCDVVGGRRIFLLAMISSVAATVAFGRANGLAMFVVIWSVNRLVQSAGWPALVKISSNWFPVRGHGRVMGILSLSYLVGDSAARFSLGRLMRWGVSWRGVFFASAAILAGITLISWFTLKSSPRDADATEPPANPNNLFGKLGESSRPENLLGLLIPFLSSLSFWLICFMSFGLTLIRETFNKWTPMYLVEVGQLPLAEALEWNALVPLFGAASVLLVGWLADCLTPGRRGAIMVSFLAVAALGLFGLSRLSEPGHVNLQIALLCAVFFFMIGPYGFLAAVISLDLGGKRGSATASGVVDAAGYASGLVSGLGVALLVERWGWSTAFLGLAGIASATVVAAGAYWWTHEILPARRRDRKGPEVANGDASQQVQE